MSAIPRTQCAIQLVGPGQLKLNPEKDVLAPVGYQILAKVECVGLCFSDLKLLKQFSGHARKSEVVSGMAQEVLEGIASYVPGERPTVPGHEVACRIVAVGEKVERHKVGERCLVQTDYRDLKTASSNAAFGYNFEGALQEYVLMDERVMVDQRSGERYLIAAPEELSASAVALVEPWACVEDSYVSVERQTIKAGGSMLVVVEEGHVMVGLEELVAEYTPASIMGICSDPEQRLAMNRLRATMVAVSQNTDPGTLPHEAFDDIIYFGAKKEVIEALNDKLAAKGILNVVLGGKKVGRAVSAGIGRVHYGGTRWIGTAGRNAAEGYRVIPRTGEIRRGDRIAIVGAGGPMGQMHVIRTVCAGIKGITVIGTDMDDARLEALGKKAAPMAKANGVELRLVNTAKEKLEEQFSYIALMAPVGALVANAIGDSAAGCRINIFAGIPAPTKQEIDLDKYIENRCFMFGTSGSVIGDMKIVLNKVRSGQLDTNCSVDAVCGMAGAAAGIEAVEKRTLAGKILVYPMLRELGLTPLTELGGKYPTVAGKLKEGQWCGEAEAELLRVAR